MKMNPNIRKVKPSEVIALQYLTNTTFLEAYSASNNPDSMSLYMQEKFSLENLTKELNNNDSEFYFIESGIEKMGFVKLNSGLAQTEKVLPNTLEIERIYVLEKHQGQKIGKSLLEFSIKLANQKNHDFIWLGVWEQNHKAIEFYKRNQFEIFGSQLFKLGNEIQTDLLMKRNLKTKI
jgi:diamine N-acetyltransferase